MIIQTIGPTSVVAYLPPEELRSRGICAMELTEQQVLELIQPAFTQAGLPPERLRKLEIYPTECGVLAFAYLEPEGTSVWYFPNSECMLSGVAALREAPDGDLYWWEEGYVLVLSGPADCLSEFGTQQEDVYLPDRLREHGKLLLERHAPALLQQYFKLQKNA